MSCQSNGYRLVGDGLQGDGDGIFAAKNPSQLAVALVDGVVGTLHQGRNVGIGKAKQIEAAIVEVTLGEGGIGFGQADGELV